MPGEEGPIDTELRTALRTLLGERVCFDEPLARSTSLRTGGPADALARPRSRDELAALLRLCRERDLPVLVLGNGFNTLVLDGGVRGVVVRLSELRAVARDERGHTSAEAGTSHATLTRFCADEGLGGLEFAVGIPGTVGGWIAMNAGIPEREMKDVALRVYWLAADGTAHDAAAADLAWHYRRLDLPAGAVVCAAEFDTAPDDRDAIKARMRGHLEHRRATQPVTEPSCGSVFKNPPGDRAGRLIEAAGLKGSRAGGAQISTLHANFIVNQGDASSGDVLELIARARDEVASRFGVHLETEVRVLGEEPPA